MILIGQLTVENKKLKKIEIMRNIVNNNQQVNRSELARRFGVSQSMCHFSYVGFLFNTACPTRQHAQPPLQRFILT